MKRIISIIAVLLILFSSTAFALESVLPDDIKQFEHEGVQYITKIYTMPSDSEMDFEQEFEQDGYKYTWFKTDAAPNVTEDSKAVEQRSNSAAVKQISYADEDGYSGILTLDNSRTTSKVSGYKTESYTISDTRYYYNLPSRDLYQIPKSVTKNGVALNFTDINWSNTNNSDAGDTATGALFTAKVTYTGKATRQVVAGYTKTYVYVGNVVKEVTESVKYAVTYIGELIPPPEPEKEPFNPIPLVAGTATGGGLVGLFLFFFLKKNVQIYNMQNGKYILIGKLRLNTVAPTIKLDKYSHKIMTNIYRISLSKSLASKLFERDITVSCRNEAVKHTVKSCEGDYIFDVTVGG